MLKWKERLFSGMERGLRGEKPCLKALMGNDYCIVQECTHR